jgi:hypothetical protein
MLVVKLFLFICLQLAYASNLYYVYPDTLGPDESVLNVDGSDYLIEAASKAIPADVIEEYDKAGILERYKLSENFIGFIFDGSDQIQKVVKARTGASGKGNIGKLKTMANGWKYHELRPLVFSNRIYVDKFFGFKGDSVATRGVNPEDHCMVTLGAERANPEEYCRDIPRCLGVLKWNNGSNICLVGNAAINEKEHSQTVYKYVEKKTRHDVFVWIEKNWVVFTILVGLAIAGQVLVPYALNTSRIIGIMRRFTPSVPWFSSPSFKLPKSSLRVTRRSKSKEKTVDSKSSVKKYEF